jgi:hypothetical protein
MSSKSKFAGTVVTAATELAAVREKIKDLAAANTSRGYTVGGTNPLIDSDIPGLEVKADDIQGFLTSFSYRLDLLMTGQVVPTAYLGDVACDKLRNDF